jgi:hypothetical protein
LRVVGVIAPGFGPFSPFAPFAAARSPFVSAAGAGRAYPEAGLILSKTLAAAVSIGGALVRTSHALFAASFTALDLSVDGMIFETGGPGAGAYVGVQGGALVVRAFNGGARWDAGTAYLTSSIPGGAGVLAWAFELNSGRVRAWWNGRELAQNGQAVGVKFSWAGADEGSYLGAGGSDTVAGEITAAAGVASVGSASGLRYYIGQIAGAGYLATGDRMAITAAGGAVTASIDGPNVLINDDASTAAVIEAGGEIVPGGGSVTVAGSGGGNFTLHSDGASAFAPGAAFAALLLGRSALSSVSYTTDRGGRASLSADIAGSLALAYALAPQDGGSLAGDPVGALAPGVAVSLSGDALITVATVGAVTRTGGAAGVAFLSFADDAAALRYEYQEAPPVDLVGVSLVISVAAGAAGRVVETAAVGGGFFRVEVVGDDLRLRVSDGSTVLTVSRAVPGRDEPFAFTAGLGSGGLFLALSGDGEGDVATVVRGAYNAPAAAVLRIGGGGASIYGGALAHPSQFDAAGAATAAADVFAVYARYNFAADGDLIMFLDPSRIDGSSATLGTPGVTTVPVWGNAAPGGGLHFAQSLEATRPLLAQSNGKWCVDFGDSVPNAPDAASTTKYADRNDLRHMRLLDGSGQEVTKDLRGVHMMALFRASHETVNNFLVGRDSQDENLQVGHNGGVLKVTGTLLESQGGEGDTRPWLRQLSAPSQSPFGSWILWEFSLLESGTSRLLLNGSEVSSSTFNQQRPVNINRLGIGFVLGNIFNLGGELGALAMWNISSALMPREIQAREEMMRLRAELNGN